MLRVLRLTPPVYLQVLMLTVLAGCGGSSGDGYSGPRGTVTGNITIDGKPLISGCQVIFMSASGGYTASGVIGEGGNYALTYQHGKLPAVEYLVQLTAPISTSPPQQVDPGKMAETMTLSNGPSDTASDAPFPPRYGSVSTSKMSFTVKDGENKVDFALTSN